MSCSVLIIEDDALLRSAIAEGLSAEGFEVKSAANGRDALSVLGHWHPDLIILDLAMPHMDGWLFRAEQRRLPSLAAIPVIVLSGAADTGAQLDELAVAAALAKPCDLEVLKATISRVLDR